MKNPLPNLKTKAKHYAPAIATGVTLGVAGTALIAHRMYHPKGKVAIQLPKGVLPKMKETGKGLAINSNEGWFTLKYHPYE